MKYSVNPNLNAVMNSIEKQLLSKGKDKPDGCVVRGIGRNVKANRNKSKSKEIEGYLTIGCMQNAILTRRAAYNTLVSIL